MDRREDEEDDDGEGEGWGNNILKDMFIVDSTNIAKSIFLLMQQKNEKLTEKTKRKKNLGKMNLYAHKHEELFSCKLAVYAISNTSERCSCLLFHMELIGRRENEKERKT